MGIRERAAEKAVDGDTGPDLQRARAAVLADDQRQFEMDFEARAELNVDAVGADDMALVEDALGDLERFEGEISDASKSIERAATS